MGLIVVGLSTLAVMELGTPSRTKTSATDPFEQLTIDESVSPDTLETADRLEMHNLQHEAPLQSVSPVESPPDVTALVPRNSNAFELGANNNKKDVVRKLKPKPKNTDSRKPRPFNRTNSNKAPKIERSKAIVEVKPCRPNALDRALNLSSRCQT